MKKGSSSSKENWAVVFKPASDVEERKEPVFSDEEIDLLVRHVHFYAEILFRWELTNKRLEMLKSINAVDVHHNGTSNAIGKLFNLISFCILKVVYRPRPHMHSLLGFITLKDGPVFVLRKPFWTFDMFYLSVICERCVCPSSDY